jgi:uncharacterized protein (UPF0335 family)
MSSKDFIAKMTNVYDQIGALDDGLKVIKEEAKSSGFDAGQLATIAKATSDGKLGKLRTKLESTLDLLDEQES